MAAQKQQLFENLQCTNKILAQQLDARLKVNANQAEQFKQQADELAHHPDLLTKQSEQIKALLQKIDE